MIRWRVAIALTLIVGCVATSFGCGTSNSGRRRSFVSEGRRNPPDEKVVYKTVEQRDLEMNVFLRAKNAEPVNAMAPILLVHATDYTRLSRTDIYCLATPFECAAESNDRHFDHGWPDEFFPLARDLSDEDHVVFVMQYRMDSLDGTNVPQALEDVRDAVDWIERNQLRFAIDPERLVLGGSGMGAWLAAAAATVPADDGRELPAVRGLLLSAPYLESTGESRRAPRAENSNPSLYDRVIGRVVDDPFEGRSDELSPSEHVRPGHPPTLMLAGAEDELVPGAQRYCNAVQAVDSECSLKLYPRAGHVFATETSKNYRDYVQTIAKAISGWVGPVASSAN